MTPADLIIGGCGILAIAVAVYFAIIEVKYYKEKKQVKKR